MGRRFIGMAALLILLGGVSAHAAQSFTAPLKPVAANATDAKPTAMKNGVAVPIEKTQPVRIPRFAEPPIIDGKLDESLWQSAATFKDFYQINPGDNLAPSRHSELMMGYDGKYLYLAFRAYDERDKIRATVSQRDNVFGDDNFRVYFDTFNDQRRAYVLGFNPFGIQQDGILTEGQGTDFNVDIVMESKGLIGDDSWTVEVKIPFKSLRYQVGKGKLWGFNVWRNIDRFNDEMDSWLPVSRDTVGTLNQFGHITGFEDLEMERTFEVIPSLTVSETGRRVSAFRATMTLPALQDPGRIVNQPIDADYGLTLKFGITPNITLDAAFNPDFAQVEADAPVITANQRFPIFFSEKRPFFLEGIEIFQTPIRALHTRAIVDPDYAVKLSGKQGRTTFGAILASDNAPGNFSEEEVHDPDIFPAIARFVDKNAYIGVLRLKRDIGKESNIGLLATSYNFIERHNHLAGIDGRFRLDTQTTLNFQALATHSRRPFYEPEEDAEIYRTGNGATYFWSFDHSERHHGWSASGRGTTSDYRADVGFNQRTDTYSNNLNYRYRSEPNPKATLIGWNSFNNFYMVYDSQGRSLGMGGETNLSINLAKQSGFEGGLYKNYERVFEEEFGAQRSATRSGAFLGEPERSVSPIGFYSGFWTNPSQKYSASAFFGRAWREFDFDFGAGPRYPRVSPAALADPNAPLDPGAANSWNFNANFTYQPTTAFSASMRYRHNELTRRDTGRTVFTSNIYSLYTKYQFTRFTYARAVLDYDTLSSTVRGQYLFGWTPNPGTSFYAGYNDLFNYNGFSHLTGQLEPGFRLQGRTFFIKASYLFRRSL